MTRDYRIDWASVQAIPARDYTCAFCGREVSSATGWRGEGKNLTRDGQVASVDGNYAYWVVLCPRCGSPTFLAGDVQTPDVKFGEDVEYLPADVDRLYDEARKSMASGAHTAAVMVGRKLLMNVAVTKGAQPNDSFLAYVNYLEAQGVVTPDMKAWVDEIRELGNDANHELPNMSRDEAEALLTFVTMLLKIVYEYPERGRRSVAARAARTQS